MGVLDFQRLSEIKATVEGCQSRNLQPAPPARREDDLILERDHGLLTGTASV
jgi:hypothetical protein